MKSDTYQYAIRVLDSEGKVVHSNMTDEEYRLFQEDSLGKASNNKVKHRSRKISINGYRVEIFTRDKDLVSSSRVFKNFLNNMGNLLNVFFLERQRAEESGRQDLRRLIHNLETYNAQALQEISQLAPQFLLAKLPWNEKNELVQTNVKKDSEATANIILKLGRINQGIKTEISVFSKLDQKNPELKIQYHNIHRILMNTLYLFFPDFSEKNVFVNVEQCSFDVCVDYESISVVLYHIIQNAVKYCRPKENIEIDFIKYDDSIGIQFKMSSLRVEDDEVTSIFNQSVSGVNAVRHNLSGSGTGMALIKRIVELNNGNIEFKPLRSGIMDLNNIPYENNVIKLVLPARSRE